MPLSGQGRNPTQRVRRTDPATERVVQQLHIADEPDLGPLVRVASVLLASLFAGTDLSPIHEENDLRSHRYRARCLAARSLGPAPAAA
jgi:hypothetical protein